MLVLADACTVLASACTVLASACTVLASACIAQCRLCAGLGCGLLHLLYYSCHVSSRRHLITGAVCQVDVTLLQVPCAA